MRIDKPETAPELKSCPFCGGEPKLWVASGKWNCDGSVSILGWKVGCTECRIETYLENRDIAIEKWNRRADNG